MLNKVTLIGNLGKDPEVRAFQNGGRVANFTLATGEYWKDRNTGERREKIEWHSVSITAEGLVKLTEQRLKKGSKVYLEGQLETRKWQDQTGQDRYTTEVVLKPYKGALTLLDPRIPAAEEDRRATRDESQSVYGSQAAGGSAVTHDIDDEIPF